MNEFWMTPDEARAKFGELTYVRWHVTQWFEFTDENGKLWIPVFDESFNLEGYRNVA